MLWVEEFDGDIGVLEKSRPLQISRALVLFDAFVYLKKYNTKKSEISYNFA